jgi:DNA polymerase III sliding clamp (beta) subunit (PCNA family)
MSDVQEETTAAGEEMLRSLGIQLQDTDVPEEDYEPIPLPQQTTTLTAPPEFAVPRAVLARMVEQCMLVVPTRDFVPALKNLVLDVSDGRLSITGSDSTSTVITTTAAVRVTKPGRVLIGAQKFSGVIRLAAGSEVRLRAEDQMLHISSPTGEGRRSDWSLRIASLQDYVTLADLGDLEWHTVSRKDFVAAVNASRFAAGSDENDPGRMQLAVLNGTVTTTDKFCFAQVTHRLPADLSCEISTFAADLIVKMLERNDSEEFRLADSALHTVAEIGPVEAPDRLIVAHITESFPNEARNAIQAPLVENRDQLTLPAAELIEALQRARPTSDEETGAVALRVGVPEKGTVTIATRNRYGDESTETISGEFVRLGEDKDPDSRTVVLSHNRLIQAVRAAGLAAPGSDAPDGSGIVRLMLGVDRSRARPAFVLVCDGVPEGEPGAGSVKVVLTQVRSEWMT